MKLVLTIICFVLIAAANFGCGKKTANLPDDANANVAAETLSVDFTDPNEALAEGKRLLDENDVEKAIAALRQAVKLNPELAEAYFHLGIAYSLLETQMERSGEITEPASNSKEGRVKPNSEKAFEKAVEAYKKLLKTNADDDAAQFNMGRTYAKLNKDEEAEEAFKKAVKLKPEDTEYQTELGAILIKLAKYHEAIAPLKKAIELDESNTRAQDLLEDAEAGRRRLEYKATPTSSNTSTANSKSGANANASSGANTTVKPTDANTKSQKNDSRKTMQSANKPTTKPERR